MKEIIRIGALYILSRLTLFIVKLIGLTCRFEFKNFDETLPLLQKSPAVIALWHNRILLSPFILHRFSPKVPYFAAISKSKDADILAAAVNSFSNGSCVRVPHNRRHYALKEIFKELQAHKVLLITPDGPRGPKYKMKPGTTYVAKKAEANLFLFSWAASRYWKLNTWDGMLIPKPFSKIICAFSPPYASEAEKEKEPIQIAMDTLTKQIEDLATVKL